MAWIGVIIMSNTIHIRLKLYTNKHTVGKGFMGFDIGMSNFRHPYTRYGGMGMAKPLYVVGITWHDFSSIIG